MSQTLKFEVSIEDANVIMKHLGEGRFVEVQALIANLKAQAAPQLATPAPVPAAE